MKHFTVSYWFICGDFFSFQFYERVILIFHSTVLFKTLIHLGLNQMTLLVIRWIFHSTISFLNTDSLMIETSNHVYEWAIESIIQRIY